MGTIEQERALARARARARAARSRNGENQPRQGATAHGYDPTWNQALSVTGAPMSLPAGSRTAHDYRPVSEQLGVTAPEPEKPLLAWEPEQLVQGAERGAAGIIGLPGEISNLLDSGAENLAVYAAHPNASPDQHGMLVRDLQARRQAAREQRQQSGSPSLDDVGLPGFNDVNQFVDTNITPIGRQSEPRSVAGQYLRTVGEFAPNALIPGSNAVRAARVIAPAFASETAGQIAHEYAPESEGAARILGGLGGGLATETAIAANAARPPRAASRPIVDPEIAALEQEYGPLTQGERLRDPAMMQREMNLRRSGPQEAQNELRGFDDRRAPVIADNIMRRTATRGQDPLNPDAGSAGTALADELRTQYENMQAEQASKYDKAFELAQNERVAANEVADELLNNVDRAIEENFLDAPNARSVIVRLQNQISQGQATYGTVERARQQLNRLLGAAMRSGDDAATFAVRRIIDEVDRFVEPRLSSQARQAITQAREITQEMIGQFDEQTRPTLSTGHAGRRDPGGRTIRNIVTTDLVGEPVLDAIFGAGAKPGRATFGAVRRIVENATDRIQYRNESAASGARVPGRQRVGGRTAGQRRFNPTQADQARFGVELPKDELQALREGFIYRIRRPLDGRRAGDIIEAGTMARNLRQALHGPGKEITGLIFNESEIAAMERALKYLERITPPTGSWEPSAPGIARDAAERTLMALGTRLLGRVPGLTGAAQAIQDGMINARAIRDARTATSPPSRASSYTRPTRMPGPPTKSRPVIASVAAAAQSTPGSIRTQERRTLEPGSIR